MTLFRVSPDTGKGVSILLSYGPSPDSLLGLLHTILVMMRSILHDCWIGGSPGYPSNLSDISQEGKNVLLQPGAGGSLSFPFGLCSLGWEWNSNFCGDWLEQRGFVLNVLCLSRISHS